MTDAELKEISARADRALPGPWRLFDQWEPNNLARENVVLWDDPQLAEGVDGWVCQVPGDPADAEFIAHARTDVPLLVAEVRRLHSELLAKLKEAEGSNTAWGSDTRERVAQQLRPYMSDDDAEKAVTAVERTLRSADRI